MLRVNVAVEVEIVVEVNSVDDLTPSLLKESIEAAAKHGGWLHVSNHHRVLATREAESMGDYYERIRAEIVGGAK